VQQERRGRLFVGSFPISGGVGGARNQGDVGSEDVESDGIVGASGDVGNGGADGDVDDVGDDSSAGELGGNCARVDWKPSEEGTFFGGVDGIGCERDGE
jgi:hypothetical protein